VCPRSPCSQSFNQETEWKAKVAEKAAEEATEATEAEAEAAAEAAAAAALSALPSDDELRGTVKRVVAAIPPADMANVTRSQVIQKVADEVKVELAELMAHKKQLLRALVVEALTADAETEPAAAPAAPKAKPAAAPAPSKAKAPPKAKAKAKAKAKDPATPKKPASPYVFFLQQTRNQIAESNPDLKNPEIMKMVGQQWKQLSEQDKQVGRATVAHMDRCAWMDRAWIDAQCCSATCRLPCSLHREPPLRAPPTQQCTNSVCGLPPTWGKKICSNGHLPCTRAL
jgi:hypothetical protein